MVVLRKERGIEIMVTGKYPPVFSSSIQIMFFIHRDLSPWHIHLHASVTISSTACLPDIFSSSAILFFPFPALSFSLLASFSPVSFSPLLTSKNLSLPALLQALCYFLPNSPKLVNIQTDVNFSALFSLYISHHAHHVLDIQLFCFVLFLVLSQQSPLLHRPHTEVM